MRVIVVGGGIGGVSAALGLKRAGIEHLVLEQAPRFEEVGAGLQLSPNAVRILEWLGLESALKTFCVEPAAHLFKDWKTGEILLRTPLMPKVRETFGAPYYHSHRADLLDALVQELSLEHVRFDAKVIAVSQDEGGARVELADGSVEAADVLIAADGIHSVVREQSFRPDPPRASGCVAWRALVPAGVARDLGFERNSYIWMGPERSVVLYYVSGERLFNWVGIGPLQRGARESWSAEGAVETVLEEFTGWHEQIRKLIAATDGLFVTALHDRDPLPRWTEGRIALLGDAAHAMLPFHAQGAVQSIEDAWVLARCIEGGISDIPSALQRYEALRMDRANRVQEQSRAGEHLLHMSDPDEIARRNARFRDNEARYADGFPPGQRWLFAYDAEKAVRGEDAAWRATSW